jgi:hypothetical protein
MAEYEVTFSEMCWETSSVTVEAPSLVAAVLMAKRAMEEGDTFSHDTHSSYTYADMSVEGETETVEEIPLREKGFELSTGHMLRSMNENWAVDSVPTGNKFSCLIEQYHEDNAAQLDADRKVYGGKPDA